ncbi:MAG TPA: SUF system NifU family Fe-S cluster assembly protein [Gemmatimonadaceae bacterium]|nr:SUF system NifU family Fe-S cluster assembly protein [Gemmatimonadaceae bacterium]
MAADGKVSPAADAEALYQDVILEHYRRPRNKGALRGATHRAEVSNPTCGDEIAVEAIVDGGVIREVKFTGRGCSISQASASMMTDLARGASLGAAERTAAALEKLLTKQPVTREALGPLIAFEPVAKYPARVGCALMSWRALLKATAQ